jgi:Uma2 family endonuclease
MVVATLPLTGADLIDRPDGGKRRWLIRGVLREQEMTIRNRFHSITMAQISGELYMWWRKHSNHKGKIVSGEAGVRLPDDEETLLGADVAFVSEDVLVVQTDESTIIEGVPTLVVEILSPSDKLEEIDEMVEAYLNAGVPLIWVVDPHDRTVTIYQPGKKPTFVNDSQEIGGESALPGFRAPVANFFD